MPYIQAPGGEGEIYVPDEETARSLFPTNTATPENQDFSKNFSVGPEPWQAGYDTLLQQMGALQSQTDIYKRGSPLSADRHMQNIAKTLAKDHGITSISDIGVRYETRPAYETGSDESRTVIPEEQLPVYYNKTNNQTISSYGRMFGSENEGDGYSEYNFQPVSDGKGGTIALPVQQYSKSGMGALAQDLGPVISVVNLALMANGVPPLAVAAGNVAFQGAAGNINDIGDVLKTGAAVLVGDPGVLGAAAKVYMAYNAFDRGDVIGGLASLASALPFAGMGGLANELRFINAVKTGNIPGALTALGTMSGVFDIPLKDDLGNILKDADGVVQKVGNIKIGGQDDYITVREAVAGASIAANLLSDKPNYGLAIQMAGDLIGSKDTVIAGKAASLIEAVASDNPSAINNAVISLAGQFNRRAPGSVPIENKTANAAVAAAAPDTSTAVNQTLASTDPVTNLTASDLVARNAGNQLTSEQVAELNVANNNGLLTTDLGTGAKLDTINVSGTNTTIGNVNDDTITAGDIKPITSQISQLTSAQIAALTSTQIAALDTKVAPALASVQVTGRSSEAVGLNNDTLTDIGTKLTSQISQLTSAQIAALGSESISSLTSTQIAALDTKNVRALASVQVTGRSSEAIGLNNDTLTDIGTKTTSSLTSLTSAQIAALTSGQIDALDTKNVRALDTVTVRGTADLIGANDDTLTDTGTKTTSSLTTITSTQIPAATSGSTVLTSTQVPAATSGSTVLTSNQITTLTSNQIATGTSGSTSLTSSQIAAITTTDPRGLQTLPTSDARYWRQTGATGTGGKGGVRFFDWYDTPENRTMAPSAMTTATFGALTSKQAETIVPPAPKQYFNQATNRYYTDPTGTWRPPAGWTQTGLKGGGEVKTKHFEEGDYVSGYVPEFDSPSYGNDYGNDYSFNFDTSGQEFGNLDSAIGSGYGDSLGYDFEYDGGVMPESDVDAYLRSLPSENASYGDPDDPRNENYGNEGRAYSGKRAIDPITGSPINAKVGVPNRTISSGSNPFKGLADAAKSNPDLMRMLLAAGLGGLLGYMGRPKGIKGRGMQGSGLGLSQSQVHGAFKGMPVKRAEGGGIDGYAGGGGLHYLKSAEDGMADKIPATIDNKQPAKLSGGEFVIPADVVSHLGNGNSEAGAKQLYAMMDRIRHARTGNKKQGKQINPAKFTPK